MSRWPKLSVAERFWAKVDKGGPLPAARPELGSCWLWTAAADGNGYGRFRSTGSFIALAHRFAYEDLVGPIAADKQLDHLCRVRCCVRPSHLEPVALQENVARGESPSARQARQTHCIYGHPLAGDNLHITSLGRRHCRACDRHKHRMSYAKRRLGQEVRE